MNFFFVGLLSFVDCVVSCFLLVYSFHGFLHSKNMGYVAYEGIHRKNLDGSITLGSQFYFRGAFWDWLRSILPHKHIHPLDMYKHKSFLGFGFGIYYWPRSLVWLNSCSTSMCMLAIAIERYVMVCRPTEVSDILTKPRRVIAAVVVTCLIPLCWYNSRKDTDYERPFLYQAIVKAIGNPTLYGFHHPCIYEVGWFCISIDNK